MNNKGLTSEVTIDAYDKITDVLDSKLDESEIAFEKQCEKFMIYKKIRQWSSL